MTATTRVDGRTVTYREAGDGPGSPLLLVHGFTGSKEDFDAVVAPLAEQRRVVAVDLPGHGGSEGSDDPAAYGLAVVASWLLRFADAVGLAEMHLLGHSLGGLVVQRTASLASQRLQSLLLMATGLGALREEAGDHVVRMAVAARDFGMQAALEEVLKRPAPTFVPPANPQREAFVLQRFHRLSPAAVVGGARNLIGAAPLGAFLYGIDIPVLVISGEHDDAWTPAEQALLARTVAGARHVVVPDSAHAPQLENTEYWLKAVGDFLAEADGPTAG
jgi:pimeloyl-ACP methyl ester carboxylesterase